MQNNYNISFDSGDFSPNEITPLHHNFHLHPAMELQSLAELAKRLSKTKQCRFILPGVEQKSEFFHQSNSPDGRDIDEVFDRIREPGSWIALYNVETDPEYRNFLKLAIDTVRPEIEKQEPGIFNVGGFVFISAPPSVTPFHIDRENNCWLQIKGRKTITVFDRTDREHVAAEDVENFVVYRNLDHVCLNESLRQRGHDFVTEPGTGVYFPATSPHMTRTTDDWVSEGNEISISIGIVFYSSITQRHARVHQLNYQLRHLGMNPKYPGESVYLDRVKAPIGHAIAALKARFRGYNAPPGVL